MDEVSQKPGAYHRTGPSTMEETRDHSSVNPNTRVATRTPIRPLIYSVAGLRAPRHLVRAHWLVGRDRLRDRLLTLAREALLELLALDRLVAHQLLSEPVQNISVLGE